MPVDRPAPWLRPIRTLYFAAGSVADAVIAPFAVVFRRRDRVARDALAAAGRSPRGAFRLDVARVALRRRQRRFGLRMRRLGPDDLACALSLRGVEGLRTAVAAGRGVIVLLTHGGPEFGVAAAMRRLSIDFLGVRASEEVLPWSPPLRMVRFEPTDPARARARVLLACRSELRQGGVVGLTLEGFSSRARVAAGSTGGSPVRGGGGAGALARRLGAAVVPATARVGSDGVLSVAFAPPLALPDPSIVGDDAFDAEVGAQANAAFERLLEDAPALRFERLVWARRIESWYPGTGRASS
jgi:hypothetical protein